MAMCSLIERALSNQPRMRMRVPKHLLRYNILLHGKLRPLGRPRRRWEDNIRMDLEETGINAGNWVDSAQDRNYRRALVNAALNLRVP